MSEPGPEVNLTIRKRAHKPKVRTGCVTCKIRRIKCDEVKPACLRCTSSGRKCDGYAIPRSWIFEVKRPSPDHQELLRPLPTVYGSASEERALSFFRENTSPVLSSVTSESRDFWKEVVPQISQSSAPVKHMIIAAAYLQEALDFTPSQAIDYRALFCRNYSQAVAILTDIQHPPPVDIVLISCLLFLTCENFQGSTMAGLVHIYNGMRILNSWKVSNQVKSFAAGSVHDLIYTYISPIFSRFDAQLAVYRSQRSEQQRASVSQPAPNATVPVIPKKFQDLIDARDSLHDIMHLLFNNIRFPSHQFSNACVTETVGTLLKQWHKCFSRYRLRLTEKDVLEARTATALQIHYNTISVILDCSFSPVETVFDKYTEEFGLTLEHCDTVIRHREIHTSSDWNEYSERMLVYEFDLGMIAPLFFIATHCRDPKLRRKAIRLMRYLHRQEHVWDTCSAAKIAEGIMLIEERGLTVIRGCEDITEHSRIRALMVDILPGLPSKVVLHFARSPYEVEEEELLDWATWSMGEIPTTTQWPVSSVLKTYGYQGLIRPVPGVCLCKVYQAEFAQKGLNMDDPRVKLPSM